MSEKDLRAALDEARHVLQMLAGFVDPESDLREWLPHMQTEREQVVRDAIKHATEALAAPTEKAAPHSSGLYSDYPNGIALSTDKAGVVLNEAYQLICPLTQGRKVDDLWIDAAKDWCKEASVTEKAPIDIYAATGIPDLDKIPDGSTADQIYASRTEKDPQKEAEPELAGICIVCNRDVYHRAGKPGEYDHKCEQTSEGQSIIRKRLANEIEQWMGDNWTRDYPLAAQETDKILDRVFGEASDSMANLSEDYAKERQTPELPQSPESESKDV